MKLRQTNVCKLGSQVFDVLILGGGINGAVSAAALARKGARVALIDKGDFAGHTSSNSSNLAWGGIKYLESHEYWLVNSLCKCRNHLMRSYPSTVKEIRFLTTLQRGFRFPAWMVYLGTILYWVIGRMFTRFPRYHTAQRLKAIEPIINIANAQGGFEYSDAYLFDNDARFVFNFIRTAMDSSAVVANYVKADVSTRKEGLWHTQATDCESGQAFSIRSKMIINACGPYVDSYNQASQQSTPHHHLFSKGVHLVVDKLPNVHKVLAFFASDGRLFFVIPMGQKTCIGTTDDRVEDVAPQVTDQDREFILDNANKLLALPRPLSKQDVIAERCGVRPLAVREGQSGKDWMQLSRKHAVDVNSADKYVSVFGGKITDCLNMGEEICQHYLSLGFTLPHPDANWYGESPDSTKQEFLHRARLANLDAMTPAYSCEPLSQRLWRRYDMHAMQILDEIQRDPSQAEQLIENAEYIRAELHYAARREMITKLEDFLRRRSKIEMVVRAKDYLHSPGIREACQILFGDQAEQRLQQYKDEHHPQVKLSPHRIA